MKATFFNFSHDLALARNVANYTPPRNVQIMERDLASLVNLLPEAEIAYTEHAPVWGWDISLVHKLQCSMFNVQCSMSNGQSLLPTPEQLADIRRLSSRLTAVEMLPAIRQRLPAGTTVGESWYAKTMDNVQCSILNSQFLILKFLYSGSGRGLRIVEAKGLENSMPKGDFVIEPYYDKVADFALEYLATPTEVQFLGVSLFETNANNAYLGNCIAPQRVLWQRISKYVPQFDFEHLIGIVRKELSLRFVGHYLGPLGVDMMIVKNNAQCSMSNAQFKLHPCVEVNVRRTMGELSLHILPLLADGVEGYFRIVFDKDSASLHRSVAVMPPAVYDGNGKLVSGTMLLTPLTDDTHYVAVVGCGVTR